MKKELVIECWTEKETDETYTAWMRTSWPGTQLPTEEWSQPGFLEKKYAEDFMQKNANLISSQMRHSKARPEERS